MSTYVLGALLALLTGVLIVACGKIESLSHEVEVQKSKHRECHAHEIERLLERKSPWRGVEMMREAADDWDNPANSPSLSAFTNRHYTPGGPSVPALWLRDRAKRIEDTLIASLDTACPTAREEDTNV